MRANIYLRADVVIRPYKKFFKNFLKKLKIIVDILLFML